MSMLNALLRPLFDGLLSPFRGLPPIIGLLVISFFTSIAILLVYKKTSNQDQLAAVKRRIHASLFEIRLFNDDMRAIFRAQFDILRHNLTYVRLSFAPLLWMLIPIVLMVAQLQFHYGYDGLKPGDKALLQVQLAEGAGPAGQKPDVKLVAPAGITVETEPVWIPARSELTWRLGAEEWGTYDLELQMNGESFTKQIDVSDKASRRSPIRQKSSFMGDLLYPAEEALPKDSPLQSITLDYTEAEVDCYFFEMHWLILFLLLPIVFALILRKPMDVTI